LIQLLERWLREERQRKPFTVISQEQEATVELGGLALKVRTDRVDRLDDGRLVVIDYKTGLAPSVTAWAGNRLAEPQLPLYAVTSEEPVAAVAFAQVKAEKRLFRGAAEEKGLLPLSKHVALDNSTRTRWRDSLEATAREFLAGDARVDPQRGACGFCKLDSLCRKYELLQAVAEDEDAG
jgi:exodeoxyribonuclease-5